MSGLIVYPSDMSWVQAGSDKINQFQTVSFLSPGELQVILNKSNVLVAEI